MQKKLTITLNEEIYRNLYLIVGSGKISKFIEESIKPYLKTKELEKSYVDMGKDIDREKEALEWIEGVM